MDELLYSLHYEDLFGTLSALILVSFIARFFSIDPTSRQWSARIAGLALIAHAVLQWDAYPPATSGDLTAILFRAVITGAFAWGLATIILSVVFSIDKLLVKPICQRIRSSRHAWEFVIEQRHKERLAEKARRRAQREWELSAPQRERARLEAEERARQARSDQKRRENARLECELFYALYSVDIVQRFGRGDFDQFVKKYMRDDLVPSEVEDRSRQLQAIVRQHVEKVQPSPRFKSLEELAGWFQQQKQPIDALTDERMRRNLLVRLNERYAEMTTHFLEESQS